MKPRLSRRQTNALTQADVVVVVFVLFFGLVFLWFALSKAYSPRKPLECVSLLKQIGVAYRLWAGDNNDKYPMVVSVTNGGAMDLVAAGNVAACFRVMSNELSTPKILVCPQDTHRVWATNFSILNNSNISYFVGLDATNETNPRRLLSGDDNLAIDGVPVKSGVLQLPADAPVAWTKARHKFVGNIGLADGSVQQVTTDGLQEALLQTGQATNRLAIP